MWMTHSLIFCTSFFALKDWISCFKCLRAMPAMHTSKEIRSDGSSSHLLPLCSVPLPLQISFFSNCIFLFSVSTYVAFSSFLPSACLPLFFSHPLSVVGSLPGTMHIPSWKIWSFVQTPASKICPEKSLMSVSMLQTSLFAFPSLLFDSFSHIWACSMPPLLAAFLFNVYSILHHEVHLQMGSCTDLIWKIHHNSSEFSLCSTLSRHTFLHPSTARAVWRKTDGSCIYA